MSFSITQELGRPITIKDEGVNLTTNVSSIDFVGSGVLGTNVGAAVTETVSAGGSWTEETPTGAVNGVNVTFTLTGTPMSNALWLQLGGIYQTSGGIDYTLSGSTITFINAPQTRTVIRAKYQTAGDPWTEETPTGSINAVNLTFTITTSPSGNSLFIQLNGAYQAPAGVDYTLSGTTVTFNLAPPVGSVIRAKYQTTWVEETPTGAINGSNVIFTISTAPLSNTLFLQLNGAYQTPAGTDYTLSGTTITFVLAPLTGSVLRAKYRTA